MPLASKITRPNSIRTRRIRPDTITLTSPPNPPNDLPAKRRKPTITHRISPDRIALNIYPKEFGVTTDSSLPKLSNEQRRRRLEWADENEDTDWLEDGWGLAITLHVDISGFGARRDSTTSFELDICLTAYWYWPGMVRVRRADDDQSDFKYYFEPLTQLKHNVEPLFGSRLPSGAFGRDLNPLNDIIPPLIEKFRSYLLVANGNPTDSDEWILRYNRFFKVAFDDVWKEKYRYVLLDFKWRVDRLREADGDLLFAHLKWW